MTDKTRRLINGPNFGLAHYAKKTQFRRITHIKRSPAGGIHLFHQSCKRHGGGIPETSLYLSIDTLRRLLDEAEKTEVTTY